MRHSVVSDVCNSFIDSMIEDSIEPSFIIFVDVSDYLILLDNEIPDCSEKRVLLKNVIEIGITILLNSENYDDELEALNDSYIRNLIEDHSITIYKIINSISEQLVVDDDNYFIIPYNWLDNRLGISLVCKDLF